MKVIDTHSHFNLSQFDADREDAIARMVEAGVGTICIGIDEATSAFAVDLAHTHDSIWAIGGQHPTEWATPWNAEAMKELATKSRVVGVGECGLDYFRPDERAHIDEQRRLFAAQIALAVELDLPLMLHIRPEQGTMTAYEDALAMLESHKEAWPTMRGTGTGVSARLDMRRCSRAMSCAFGATGPKGARRSTPHPQPARERRAAQPFGHGVFPHRQIAHHAHGMAVFRHAGHALRDQPGRAGAARRCDSRTGHRHGHRRHVVGRVAGVELCRRATVRVGGLHDVGEQQRGDRHVERDRWGAVRRLHGERQCRRGPDRRRLISPDRASPASALCRPTTPSASRSQPPPATHRHAALHS